MKTGNPLPDKLRRAIVRAFRKHHFTYAEIADLLGVGEASVSRMLRLHREKGHVRPRPRGGGNFSPIRGDVAKELKKAVRETPDATVSELMEDLARRTGIKTSRSSMKRALHRLGFTRKKRSSWLSSGTPRETAGGGVSSQPF